MKYILLIIIKLYWLFKAKNKSPCCIFKKNCSRYVYEETKKKGFYVGLLALKYRIQNCKYGFEIYTNPNSGKLEMILPKGDILETEKIAERLLN
ncbi:membrane protein insertion efficiency factor YidD [uncultured Tenacibaculum sp.]|uniref:membrane protein insertion efficiency factor YidD n=1 Tax=uncultured Tenacibaculum sp. TaxID=174713 RepID=UPI0026284250|nr:membrane protein insertion efficiency factor YidD [uncultured Tenacibaculum sp.]